MVNYKQITHVSRPRAHGQHVVLLLQLHLDETQPELDGDGLRGVDDRPPFPAHAAVPSIQHLRQLLLVGEREINVAVGIQ